MKTLCASVILPLAVMVVPASEAAPKKAQSANTGAARVVAAAKPRQSCGSAGEVQLFAGESRVISTPDLGRIAVGTSRVMSVQVVDDDAGKAVIVSGNGQGDTTLHLWNRDGSEQCYRVTVHASDVARNAKEIAAFLSSVPHAKVSIVGDKVIVEGDALSDAHRDRVAELAKRYPQIVNFTSPIGWEKMVMMEVKVVEFPRTVLKEIGLKWTSGGGGALGAVWSPFKRGDTSGLELKIGGSPMPITRRGDDTVPAPSGLAVMSGFNLGLSAQLNLLEQDGSAVTLAEPYLSTRSGFKASFLAGGELPYSVANVNGVTVVFKPYGIKLDIEPRVGNGGVIRAIIDTEVSSVDASISTTVGPALLTRRARTEFNVLEGETIVLSGLLQRGTNTSIDKVPLLGDLPVLGALFRSKRYQNKETELVVFVTPRIVDGGSDTERLGETRQRIERELAPLPVKRGQVGKR